MTTVVSIYPDYLEQVKQLVAQHLELVEEPLLLAIYYRTDRAENDVFLLEVLDNFNGSSIECDGDLLEVLYGSTPHFMLRDRDAVLQIILASPEELLRAATKNTSRFREVKHALAEGRAQKVYGSPEGDDLMQVFSNVGVACMAASGKI